jgi:hypothetical protein
MSREAFIKFYEDVVRNDQSLLAEIAGTGNEAELAQLAVSKGKAAGFDFNEQDVTEVMQAARAKREEAPLTEDQLESVSGGILISGTYSSSLYMQDFSFVSTSLISSFGSFNYLK